MSPTNGHSTTAATAVAGTRPVVLLRYRPGVAGETSRVMHVVPLPLGGENGAAGIALCGALLCLDQVETVTPGHGAPCNLCMVNHLSASPCPASADTPAMAPSADDARSDIGPLAAAVCYRVWGWPVTLRGKQVWLNLEPDTVALIIPALLATQVTEILNQRRCPPLASAAPSRCAQAPGAYLGPQWGPATGTGIRPTSSSTSTGVVAASMGSGHGDRNQNAAACGFVARPPPASMGSGHGDRNQNVIDVEKLANTPPQWGPATGAGISRSGSVSTLRLLHAS
ncbi:MAG: hypothetical protein ACRDST_04110, partial [Pseudonocardiaceae bacterium]